MEGARSLPLLEVSHHHAEGFGPRSISNSEVRGLKPADYIGEHLA
jgi:hypothetical protein